MPYTPPSNTSPASSKTSSPVASRSGSFHEDVPRSPMTSRPQPPRSMSSASYMQRHRRSPSLSTSGGDADTAVSATDFTNMSSIRQSPPPVNNLRIPTGAVLSPPDSSENSDGDEKATIERGRELEANWDKLQAAVRALPQQREGSPNKCDLKIHHPKSEPVSQTTSPTALSADARRILHSRSSTDGKITLKLPYTASASHTSDESDEDENLLSKPALVRKKSGELVKPALRPSSRRRYSSMPGTPTYHKSVHFNDSDNQTRHFLQVDKPIAVSAGSSPVETYDSDSEFPFDESEAKKTSLDINISNFPLDTFERRTKPIFVERIFLSPDKSTLIGSCIVQNIAFHKQVVARFTLDYWKTTSEVVAEFQADMRPSSDGHDRFNFNIKLTDQANIYTRTLLLCVRYNVGGQEFWDNNDTSDYQIDFVKNDTRPSRPSKPIQSHALGQRPHHSIPRSKHTPSLPRARFESVDDDFISRIDDKSAYSFASTDKLLGDSPSSSIKLKPKPKRTPILATGESQGTKGLGSRYDFGTSLSAALSSAQEKLGQHSGLMRNSINQVGSDGSYFGPMNRTEPTVDASMERPGDITSDRPAIGSDQYKDLVQKFCYFTPGSTKGSNSPIHVTPSSTHKTHAQQVQTIEKVDDTKVPQESSLAESAGINMPVHQQQLDGSSESQSKLISALTPRVGLPTPKTRQVQGSSLPATVSFSYPFRDGLRNVCFESLTPTAIHS